MEINDLTPVEEYDGLLYKRDDLFLPFGKYGTSGGKVRQALSLIGETILRRPRPPFLSGWV